MSLPFLKDYHSLLKLSLLAFVFLFCFLSLLFLFVQKTFIKKPSVLAVENKTFNNNNSNKIATESSPLKFSATIQAAQLGNTSVFSPRAGGSNAIYFGFAFDSRSQSRVSEVEGQIGRSFPLLMTFLQWGNSQNSAIDQNFFSLFDANNMIPVVTWEPWNPAAGVDQPNFKLSAISSGNFDPYIHSTAVQIKNWGKPLFLRFAHEMNGYWYPWGGTVNGNSPSDFVAAYRHVHDIFEIEGAKNVTWVWCPGTWSVPHTQANSIASYYPGASYVDWVGLDGYNFGNSKAGQTWQSFSQIFSPGYSDVVGLGKPIMVAETASSEVGGSKENWINSTFTKELPQNFPKIKALIWFDVNMETNWDINSSPSSISQFKKVINLELYKTPIRVSNSKIISP